MKDDLLILGAGQYGQLVREIAGAMDCFGKISFLDDNSSVAIGTLSDYKDYIGRYTCAAVAMGDPQLRLEYIGKLRQSFRVPALIHPKGYVSPSARLGEGCVVEPMAVIHTNAVVGAGSLISAGAVVNHNAIIGDGCHVDCNSTVSARAEVPAGKKICAGEVFRSAE